MKVFFAAVIALFVLGGISAQLASNQSSSGCNVQDAPAQLLSADPVYADAIDVANTLNGLGVPIRCILASKMQHIFIGQKGAAFYRIGEGSFEVLFLPKTQSFDSLQIAERREGDRYIYSFRVTPQPQTNRWIAQNLSALSEREICSSMCGDNQPSLRLSSPN